MTDLEGRPLYRALTFEEAKKARLTVEGQRLHDTPLGAFVGSDRAGNAAVLAAAVDVERNVAYAEQLAGARCRADSYWWRLRHPIPRVDGSAPSS